MRGNIQKKYHSKFNPWFVTTILGQVTKISLQDAQKNAEKYINSPIGFMYEDREKLAEDIKKRLNKQGPEKLDMNDAKRGDLFDPEFESQKAKLIKKFKSDSETKRAKIKSRLEANLKASEDQKKAQQKAIKDAVKKATDKIKKEQVKEQ